ncbi:MAG: 30S ribosomal protein S12 methylthiotransferase RimO [Treponema sp.]|nr:30S ribosomal protein S12 methylthiotransferase RimO [Treponema sp.]
MTGRLVRPSYFLDPFGCVKNQVDAENMMAHLNGAGWLSAHDAADADLIIVNSCGFIEDAKRESIDAVMEWRRLYPGKKILLAGCLAQRYSRDLAESMPEVDAFFGTDDVTRIAEAVKPLGFAGSMPDGAAGLSTWDRPLLSLPGSAYVKISEGCDNNCSYCAIPLIRGPLRCRSVRDIVDECRGLLARGVRELCVIGQDIGAYRSGGSGLPELLAAVAELPGDFWVRLLYMHPGHFPLPILDLMERDRRFLPYFDIPFQHSSPAVLSAMNRRGSAEAYLALVETIRARLPAAVVRTTFLVGFPGETRGDFAALLDFQERLRPDWLGCFSYSREEDTAAYAMPGQVPRKTALARKLKVEEAQVGITEGNMERFVGQTLDIMLEEKIDGGTGDDAVANGDLWLGRLYCHAPEVDGAAITTGSTDDAEDSAGPKVVRPKVGDVLPCRVLARRGFVLEVSLCRPSS